MWCDDFDMDLLKIFPPIGKWFRQPIIMWTLCRPTNGTINCPAYWNGIGSLVFVQHWSPRFLRDEHGWVNIYGCVTDDPWVRCTPLELVRDMWVHQHVTQLLHESRGLKRILAFDKLSADFTLIMWRLRKIGKYTAEDEADARYRCLRRLWRIARKIEEAGRISEQLRVEAVA